MPTLDAKYRMQHNHTPEYRYVILGFCEEWFKKGGLPWVFKALHCSFTTQCIMERNDGEHHEERESSL